MSAPMKKHRTENDVQKQFLYITDKDQLYAIPKTVAKRYIVDIKRAVARSGNIPAETVFAELDKKQTKAGVLLKGLRSREGLSQVKFAKKIGVTQANLSKMEKGVRPIGLAIAQRIAKAFDVNINYFSDYR